MLKNSRMAYCYDHFVVGFWCLKAPIIVIVWKRATNISQNFYILNF